LGPMTIVRGDLAGEKMRLTGKSSSSLGEGKWGGGKCEGKGRLTVKASYSQGGERQGGKGGRRLKRGGSSQKARYGKRDNRYEQVLRKGVQKEGLKKNFQENSLLIGDRKDQHQKRGESEPRGLRQGGRELNVVRGIERVR